MATVLELPIGSCVAWLGTIQNRAMVLTQRDVRLVKFVAAEVARAVSAGGLTQLISSTREPLS